MAKKMLIDATHAEETRVVVVDGNKVEEFDFESEKKRQLAGNIYLAKVTRVEPSLQAAFVDYGGNRHGFLAFSEIHPDYYQIPVADRQALMEEEEAQARAEAEEEQKPKRRSRSRSRRKTEAESAETGDKVTSTEAGPAGMETIDLDEDEGEAGAEGEGLSPMETVGETPVADPSEGEDEPAGSGGSETSEDSDDDADEGARAAKADDDSIESVADDDTEEDIRPARKSRTRRYKIQEVIKVRQILLVQVVKEERGNKGAALTTYLSLAGRYCVLMPNTARGGGISRKITNAADRSKLKEIAGQIDVPKGAGLIIRTAGAKRTKTEIKRDYEYLQRLWEQIRELTLQSIAPAKIYEEGDLIKRSIRDLYNRDIDEVHVEGDRGYRIAKDFMKMIMPSHAKNVKHYVDPMPLFARYQVESYLSSMFNPTVQLKSGGYIVIGVTEALVAIDVNSGRATKEGSIEETALKTNLEAAEEVARQLRLRDLAGLIVIDFIDMDERKNNAAVEKKLKEKLKTDRARIQVGRISGFGLLEMSRQRLRPGMIEATTQPCPACHGTGLIRSDDNMALQILRQIEEEGTRRRSREVLVKCPVGIANFLMNQKREHIAGIELRYGMAVQIEGDPSLVSPDFSLEKFKTASRAVPEATSPVVSADNAIMAAIDADADAAAEAEAEAEAAAAPDPAEAPPAPGASEEGEGDQKPKKKRRRRRRSKKSGKGEGNGDQNGNGEQNGNGNGDDAAAETPAEGAEAEGTPAPAEAETAPASSEVTEGGETPAPAAEEETPKKKPARSRSSRSRKKPEPAETAETPAAEGEGEAADAAPAEGEGEPAPKPKRSTRSRSRKKPTPELAEEASEEAAEAQPSEEPAEAPVDQKIEETPAAPEPEATETGTETAADPATEVTPEVAAEPAPEPEVAVTPEPEAPVAEPAPEPEAERPLEPAETGSSAEDDKPKPKRRGWWNLGR
ncbi:Rne/Rng family ribonuclease [Roseivivax sp. GX 12232]|uniref:ribonuclease E/G n=1 Tax=Roseivivax sp. GX 12232 TaxID=2900547 RepID=UPI001E2B8D1C|nr:ribonuclease E/G [Roseivivax sp. GX 12232]MCE0506741.1 Rne/Rng family ribonuclease [Roseivivax sp. GX 12232]